MRPIDADALIPIMKYATTDSEIGIFPIRIGFESIVNVIESAPIVDAVEVVRCKECKKANTEDCSTSYWDDDWGVWRIGYQGDDWFCADGERSEVKND